MSSSEPVPTFSAYSNRKGRLFLVYNQQSGLMTDLTKLSGWRNAVHTESVTQDGCWRNIVVLFWVRDLSLTAVTDISSETGTSMCNIYFVLAINHVKNFWMCFSIFIFSSHLPDLSCSFSWGDIPFSDCKCPFFQSLLTEEKQVKYLIHWVIHFMSYWC